APDELLAVGTEAGGIEDVPRGPGSRSERTNDLLRRDIPDIQALLADAKELLAVGGEGNGPGLPRRTAERGHLFSRLEFPDFDGIGCLLVGFGRPGQELVVRAKRDRVDLILASGQRADPFAGAGVEESDGVTVRDRQELALSVLSHLGVCAFRG